MDLNHKTLTLNHKKSFYHFWYFLMQKHGKKIHMYAFELCAAISDDF